ncbi:TetR family transcriptional regulator [Winogradskyella sp. 3972H.M.0a.05]|uniref:TetR/AcrR family transcriptional regulator n=1 Tax=Winogradskyella sp. 3972H.M.0a.05 TaxID=2950277 RepID=UPI00339859EA
MRPQKVQDIEMLNGLMSVFRSKGYEGASMAELSEATGLKKASLYHRYPGGKKDMTLAVLVYLEENIKKHVYNVLTDSEKGKKVRLEEAIRNIKTLYDGGSEVCIYRSLSLDSGIELFGAQIKQGIHLILNGFKQFGLASGMSETDATEKANQTFIEIQGSLVMSKALQTTKPFIDSLEKIRLRYI